jgi:hypothetical protein
VPRPDLVGAARYGTGPDDKTATEKRALPHKFAAVTVFDSQLPATRAGHLLPAARRPGAMTASPAAGLGVRVAFDGSRAPGESEDMIPARDDNLNGADDFVAEVALAKRARQRRLAEQSGSLCRVRFTHPRRPTQVDLRGFLVVNTCECLLQSGHDDGCMCEHNIERRVYRVDANGREHYATRPLA